MIGNRDNIVKTFQLKWKDPRKWKKHFLTIWKITNYKKCGLSAAAGELKK
jgi:hypothetical protein